MLVLQICITVASWLRSWLHFWSIMSVSWANWFQFVVYFLLVVCRGGMNALCKRSVMCVRNRSSWHWWAATDLLCVWHSLDHLLIDGTQLTNGQHACVLVFAPVADIFEHTLWLSICFLCRSILNDFMLHITLDAENHRLRVHYKCEIWLFHFYKVG